MSQDSARLQVRVVLVNFVLNHLLQRPGHCVAECSQEQRSGDENELPEITVLPSGLKLRDDLAREVVRRVVTVILVRLTRL